MASQANMTVGELLQEHNGWELLADVLQDLLESALMDNITGIDGNGYFS
jgi:hypothetical protein